MVDLFSSDMGNISRGYILSLKANVALEIVKYCALVTGYPDGEDSGGRAKIALMDACDVAMRSADIANDLVNIFVTRGWIKETTMTLEEESEKVGRLEGIRHESSFRKPTNPVK
jgi:hypothetical protein